MNFGSGWYKICVCTWLGWMFEAKPLKLLKYLQILVLGGKPTSVEISINRMIQKLLFNRKVKKEIYFNNI